MELAGTDVKACDVRVSPGQVFKLLRGSNRSLWSRLGKTQLAETEPRPHSRFGERGSGL
jgi:hypothetical protein